MGANKQFKISQGNKGRNVASGYIVSARWNQKKAADKNEGFNP